MNENSKEIIYNILKKILVKNTLKRGLLKLKITSIQQE
jgi:hypothetical protein